MKYFNLILICIFFALPSILNSRPSIVSDENINKFDYTIVKIDKESYLTMPQLYAKISNMKIMRDGGILDTNFIRQIIDSIIIDTLVGLEANNINIDDHITEKQIFKNLYYSHLASIFYDDQIYSKVEVDSQKVINFFFDRIDIFGVLVTVKYSDIFLTIESIISGIDSSRFKNLSDGQLVKEIKDYINEIRSSISSKEDFIKAMKSYSIDTSITNTHFLVGFGSKYRNEDAGIIDSVAYNLDIDSVSVPFEDENGWHIIYINNRTNDEAQPLPKWIYKIAVENYKENRASEIGSKLLDSLLKSVEMEYNEELFDKDISKVFVWTWMAVVNKQDTIYVSEARSQEESYKRKYKIELTDASMKRGYLKMIARKYLVIQAARNSGIENKPEVISKKKEYQHSIAREMVKKNRHDRNWLPSDSLVIDYYGKNRESFIEDKPLKVQHIVTTDSLFGEELRSKAISGVDFMQLAEEYYPGIKSIRRELADLGYIGKDDITEDFFDTASKLKIGEISHPVKTKFGYHIIKLLDRKKIKDLSKMRSRIYSILINENNKKIRNKFENDLRTKYNVKYEGDLYPIQLKPQSDRNNK